MRDSIQIFVLCKSIGIMLTPMQTFSPEQNRMNGKFAVFKFGVLNGIYIRFNLKNISIYEVIAFV